MKLTKIQEHVLNEVSLLTGDYNVQLSGDLRGYGCDSLDIIEVILGLEDEFDIEILGDMSDVKENYSLENLCIIVEDLLEG